jgi:hypothetical protein
MPDTPDEQPDNAHKEDRIEIRVERELAQKARQKAAERGWSLSAVLRGLLTLWADEDVIDARDVGAASTRAPYKRKRKAPRKKKG